VGGLPRKLSRGFARCGAAERIIASFVPELYL